MTKVMTLNRKDHLLVNQAELLKGNNHLSIIKIEMQIISTSVAL